MRSVRSGFRSLNTYESAPRSTRETLPPPDLSRTSRAEGERHAQQQCSNSSNRETGDCGGRRARDNGNNGVGQRRRRAPRRQRCITFPSRSVSSSPMRPGTRSIRVRAIRRRRGTCSTQSIVTTSETTSTTLSTGLRPIICGVCSRTRTAPRATPRSRSAARCCSQTGSIPTSAASRHVPAECRHRRVLWRARDADGGGDRQNQQQRLHDQDSQLAINAGFRAPDRFRAPNRTRGRDDDIRGLGPHRPDVRRRRLRADLALGGPGRRRGQAAESLAPGGRLAAFLERGPAAARTGGRLRRGLPPG